MGDEILQKLESWNWSAAVYGLGYVGLPLAVTLARAGVPVTGFDLDAGLVAALGAGRSHIDDVTDDDLSDVAAQMRFTTDPEQTRDCDVLFVCVPTPLAVGKQPDTSFIEGAARTIATVLRPGHVVILESTTYPGTTQNTVLPLLEAGGLALDRDFFLAYSPERIDPGNSSFRTSNIPRIVGGASPASSRAAELVYRRFVSKVHLVSDARTAEMAKLLENTFRWVNIALVNELSLVARAIGIDIWEVIEAAATKPFGYMPFYPGPGVGGHCIPLDPFYLQWAARLTGDHTQFIEVAELINSKMPQITVSRVQEALNDAGTALRGARILVIGVAFKPNVKDHRQSASLECIKLLQRWAADVSYHDPFVAEIDDDGIRMASVPLTEETVGAADCALILCDHDAIDYQLLAREARLVVDARNALRRRGIDPPGVVRL